MKWIELGELCEVKAGQGAPQHKEEYSEKGIPFIRAGNLEALTNGNPLDICDKVAKEAGDAKGLKLQKEGSVVFAKSGMSCLKSYIYRIPINCYVVNHLACLTVIDDRLSSRYLCYVLNYIKPKTLINDLSYPSIRLGDISKMKIPVPPMDTQKRIVEVLDEAQSLIDKRKEQIELLDDLIESIFYDMFGDPVKNDKGWKVKKLGELIEVNPKKSEISGIKDSDLEISFVPMENVLEDGKLILEETRKISDVYKGYTYFKEDDILFAKITPCMENGKGCIAKGLLNNIGFGSTEFHVLRPKNNLLAKEYVFHLSKSKKFRKEAENKMTGSAGQKRVPKKFIEDYFINVPPLLLQNQFAGKVEAIEKQKELMEESLKLMEDNYNSIMQRAFKGELF